jgi:membrane-associated phospholipid phosphatase/DNA-binding beta-propeller fold protein YncE
MRRLWIALLLTGLLVLTLAPASAQDGDVTLGDPIASSLALPGTADAVALSPDGLFAFVLLEGDSLAVYTIGPDGQLALLPDSPSSLGMPGGDATAMALSPDGTRLYIANAGALEASGMTPIRVFAVDPLSGALSFLGDASVSAEGGDIGGLAVSADGTQLLVSGFKNGGLAIFPAPFLTGSLPGIESLTESFGPETALAWMQTLYDRVQADAVDAPEASRLYGYAGVALYEAVVLGIPANRSLAGQLNGLDALPVPEPGKAIDWPTAAAASLRVTMSGLMSEDSGAAFQALYDDQVADRLAAVGSETTIQASADFGEAVGGAILAWANADGYTETRDLNPTYELPSGYPDLWMLTTEGREPVEPFWGSVRPFALSYADECAQYMNAPYSEDPNSTFYQQALEVVAVEASLTPEQRAIAEWWVDTPGRTGAPSGHWMRIGSAIIEQQRLNLAQAAELYGMLGMTLADSFISTWSLKYQINLLRPVTYIQRFIDPRWQPYIESPTFPEYPSGHSVASASAADMLTSLYGAVAFTDHTHEDQSPARSFTSFEAAATEAAFSRLYGGIHFRQAIENGMRQGECITTAILSRVAMRQFGQNE